MLGAVRGGTGLRQGCVLSPLLFKVLVAAILLSAPVAPVVQLVTSKPSDIGT